MAIASGLTCVDYLATKFHSQDLQEVDIRYSPTFTYNDIVSSIITRQRTSSNSNLNKYTFGATAAPPVLEFNKLSLVENKFDFSSQSKNDHNNNSAFITEYEKVRNILNKKVCNIQSDQSFTKSNSCSNKEVQSHQNEATLMNNNKQKKVDPFVVHSRCQSRPLSHEVFNDDLSCQQNKLQTTDSCSDDYETDDELGSIFNDTKPLNMTTDLRHDRCNFNSLPSFHKFQPRLNAETHRFGESCEDHSDSECELTKIISSDQSPLYIADTQECYTRNTRKRSSADLMHVPGACFKRPCIDADKMHGSIREGYRRNFFEKELFVPISKS